MVLLVFMSCLLVTLSSVAQQANSAARAGENVVSAAVQREIAHCKARERWVDEDGCVAWASKRARIRTAQCPDSAATTACESFKEMVAGDDSDLMNDFATKNVYVCFRPEEDVFFEVWFSEPDPWSWHKPTDEDEQKGPAGNYAQFGSAGITYYEAGVGDAYKSIGLSGLWAYASFGPTADQSELKALATSRNSLFLARNDKQRFEVQRSRFEGSENYENQSETETKHTVTVQLANGRFTETYEVQPSGTAIKTYSGRCLAVPATMN